MAEYRPPISSATQAAITAEATTRASADTALSAADVAEATARANADSAEVTARTDAINTAIAGEAAARTTGDATNATAISTEATTRAAADTANADAISVEATSRIAADTTLTTAVGLKASTAALTAETDARTAADSALDGRLDSVQSSSALQPGVAVDPRVYGAIADGTSRTLATLGYTLPEAVAQFGAHVTTLTAELDWAAAVQAINSGVPLVRYVGDYITNLPLPTRVDWQEHVVPAGSSVNNTRPGDTAVNETLGAVFEVGNMHPAIYGVTAPYPWAVHDLGPLVAGEYALTVTTPAGITQPLAAGDIIGLRSNNVPEAAGGAGTIYPFTMWNRVVSWDAGTGALVLELPVPVSIVASGADTVLNGPKLLVNDGSDTFRGTMIDATGGLHGDWWVAQGVKIHGGGKLIGASPTGIRTAGWRCKLSNLELDCQHLIGCNAMMLSEFENLWGHWRKRYIEVKQASQGCRFRNVRGVYRYDAAITPATPFTYGEQSYANEFVGCDNEIGSTFAQNLRAFEVYAPDIRYQGRIVHRGVGGQAEVWAIKSNKMLARPPGNIVLDLTVRAASGLTRYGLVGSDPDLDSVANDADPTNVRMVLDQRSDGAAPAIAVRVARGTKLQASSLIGDVTTFESITPGEAPERAPIVLTTVAGAVTFTANTETVIGTTHALRGVLVGDDVRCGLQLIGTVTAGALGSLHATAAVNGAGTVIVAIRNRSTTDVTITGTTALWVRVRWERNR